MKPTAQFAQQLEAFQHCVRSGASAPEGLLRPRASRTPSATLLPNLLAIYQHAYEARLVGALADNYLILQRAMGEEAFTRVAQAYIAQHPSTHASIRWFGDRLADFLGTQYGDAMHPAMVDLARMEWGLRAAFDAADAPVLTFEDMVSVPADAWPSLRFVMHPSVQVIDLGWTIEPVWRALRAYDPESGMPEPELPVPMAAPHALLIWRRELETQWRSLDPIEAQIARAVQGGEPFVSVCEKAAEWLPSDDAAARVVNDLRQWIADGVLSQLDLTDAQAR